MMFWGDIILKYPKLIPELAKLGRDALPRVRADQQVSPAATYRLELGLRSKSSI